MDQWNQTQGARLRGLCTQQELEVQFQGKQQPACGQSMEISTRAELFGIASALKFLLEFIKIDTSSVVTIWTYAQCSSTS